MRLEYQIGDVREPQESTPFIIPHCVNDCNGGVMGAGVALALYKRWPIVKKYYHKWANNNYGLIEGFYNYTSGPFRLGEIQVLEVEPMIYISNMVGQRDTNTFCGISPIRYEAIRDCLLNLRIWLNNKKDIKNICSPKFGASLAGGSWPIIESIIYETFEKTDYNWVIYSLPESSWSYQAKD